MRIRADEHVPRKIVPLVSDLILSNGWELTHVRDVGDGGTSDEHWITKFGREGGNAILTADQNIINVNKKPHETLAICQAGVVGIFLHHGWANSPAHMQVAHLLFWWERIEELIRAASPRTCWRVPFSFGKDTIKQLNVDFGKARQKAKKRGKRKQKNPPVS